MMNFNQDRAKCINFFLCVERNFRGTHQLLCNFLSDTFLHGAFKPVHGGES